LFTDYQEAIRIGYDFIHTYSHAQKVQQIHFELTVSISGSCHSFGSLCHVIMKVSDTGHVSEQDNRLHAVIPWVKRYSISGKLVVFRSSGALCSFV